MSYSQVRYSEMVKYSHPHSIIIKFHRFRDITTILSAARCMGNLHHEDRPVLIVPDMPPSVQLARRAFNTDLIKWNIRFCMAFPAFLS
uniref:Uncharacterized protein n=1 Tax=Periophthalmus magnuspinnatus TaxID=409849 RepID=A0A3B3ZCT9_9GOBI